MHLSQRSDYALRAMVELGMAFFSQRMLSARDIASSENIPLKFLEQILLTLKHAGFVRSKMGVKGGYMLAKPPEQITFGAIVRVFEGPVSPIGCVDLENPTFCSEKWHCRFHLVMGQLRDAISGVIDKTTLADMCTVPVQIQSRPTHARSLRVPVA